MRKFNITGLCIPHMHYMVDTSAKLGEIAEMVGEGAYFTINRARQFGKTTTFSLLSQRLESEYLAVEISFEGIDDEFFATPKSFCEMFASLFADGLRIAKAEDSLIVLWGNTAPANIKELGVLIKDFCEKSPKPVVLMIDEVDKASENQVLLNFLGMLRNKYLQRNRGADYAFKSVILAGVYDIKNLKLKITGNETLSQNGERAYNSPWNIAADFKVDMSFSPAEISTMLVEYESEHHAGMDIGAISNELYRYTSGYPFLVSKLCKTIDEDIGGDWTAGGVEQAVKLLLKDRNTLFDDIAKNLMANKKLSNLVSGVVIDGRDIKFSPIQPEIELGSMFGLLADKDGKVVVANEIFELLITEYFSANMEIDRNIGNMVLRKDVIQCGRFSMSLCLEKFGGHFYELYNRYNAEFLESHGRLLFITYLKPLINGNGFYHIEPETRDMRRMDLVVDYGEQQFVVEMKLWHGDKKHEDAYEQLWDYLDGKGANDGYLLTFDFRKDGKRTKAEWVNYKGKRIFDVVV